MHKGLQNFLLISVTNPIDVIKIRMQLDNELSQTKGDVTVALKYVWILSLLFTHMYIVLDLFAN